MKASGMSNLKRVTLELGGKSPNIICMVYTASTGMAALAIRGNELQSFGHWPVGLRHKTSSIAASNEMKWIMSWRCS
jgi:hypothetical protein